MSLPILLILVMFIEGFLHYFPWRLMLKNDLPKVAAYTLGVAGLMVPFTGWLWEQGYQDVINTLWAVIFAGGAMVAALYAFDDWWKARLNYKDAIERERLALTTMKEAVHAKE